MLKCSIALRTGSDLVSRPSGDVTYTERRGSGLDTGFLDMPFTILDCCLQPNSISPTRLFTWSSWSAVPLQPSGNGFQRRTFLFMGSRTVPVSQPQRLSTHLNSILNCFLLSHAVPSGAFSNNWVMKLKLKLKLIFWPTVSRPVLLGVGSPFGAYHQIVNFL
jgi:hypothetical protein